jgi:hypothetical protein
MRNLRGVEGRIGIGRGSGGNEGITLVHCLFYCLFTACPLPVHSLPIACACSLRLPIHCIQLFTADSLPIHCLFTTMHCLFAAYPLSTAYWLFTAYSLLFTAIHCLFTALSMHCQVTACSLSCPRKCKWDRTEYRVGPTWSSFSPKEGPSSPELVSVLSTLGAQ